MTNPSAIRRVLHRPSESIREVTEIAELASVFEPAVQIVRLAREPDAAIVRELDDVLRTGSLGCGGRAVLAANAPFDGAVLPPLDLCQALCADLGGLTALYADLMGCPAVGLRLEVMERAMCPRFHVDRVALRLLVTYRGPATEWLDDAAVDRSKLGGGGADALPDAQCGLVLGPGAVGRARPYDIVLLKGCGWPGNEARGAIHRSPAVPAGLAPRLLLAVDAVWP